MKIIDLFFPLSKKSSVANLVSPASPRRSRGRAGGRNTGGLESYLIGIWRYGKSNNFPIVITFIAVLMIAVICSCGMIKTHKKVEKVSAYGSEMANVKTLEYYRNYIQKNLPFKKILWEAVFGDEKIRKLVRRGDSLYVETDAHRLYSVSTKTGFRQWQSQLPGPTDFFISTVADLPKKESELKKSINDTEKEITNENKSKGRDEDKVKSLKRLLDSFKEEYLSLRSKDVIYLTCNGSIYCIDRSNGNVIWQNRLPFIPSTVPCATIASVFIGALDYNRVYQIDSALKYEKDWFRAEESIVTTPLYENLIIYFGSSDGKVYAYDTMLKKLLWTYPTEKAIKTDMILDDDILYVGSTDFAVYAIDRYAGILLWKFETGRPITSPIILDKNQAVSGTNVSNPAADKIDSSKTLYVYSDKNGLYALNALTVFVKDNDNPEREKILRKAKPIWKFEEGKSLLIRGLFYTYVIGVDNLTLYSVLNKQSTDDNTIRIAPRPQIKEKYNLSIFPLRYGDLEENTVYLATSDGYIFSVKE
ncbi:MAG: PQQ-binding-like beta-propeller repeat protein [Planctomycetota bacterium]